MCKGVCTRGAWYECVWECVHVERGMSVYGSVYTWSVVRVCMAVCVHVERGTSMYGRVYTWSVV